MGLNVNDFKGIIDVCEGLSLNDSFWVVPENFTGSFVDYNLYENGMLRKAWCYIKNDGIYLFKGGTEGAIKAGKEL